MNYLSREARREAVSDEQLNDLIIDCIQDIKGKNIVKLDLRQLKEAPADFFIICEGDSNTQIRAEGKDFGRWVLLDYYNTLVHVFHPEARAYYDLEDLWSDAQVTSYENL